jgi:hypothetical protein
LRLRDPPPRATSRWAYEVVKHYKQFVGFFVAASLVRMVAICYGRTAGCHRGAS